MHIRPQSTLTSGAKIRDALRAGVAWVAAFVCELECGLGVGGGALFEFAQVSLQSRAEGWRGAVAPLLVRTQVFEHALGVVRVVGGEMQTRANLAAFG